MTDTTISKIDKVARWTLAIILALSIMCIVSTFLVPVPAHAQDSLGGGLYGATPASRIRGTTTNDTAVAGYIGEQQSTVLASGSAVSLSTGATSNVITQSLGAGDWDCDGSVDLQFGATTSYTALAGGISTSTGALGAQDTFFSYVAPATVPTATPRDMTFVVPTVRVSLNTTTNIFLVSQGTFTVSTLKAYGTIRCRRMR